MSQLFFKKQFQDAIREGRKRTTIRRWDKPRLKVGQRAFSPGLGWLQIDSVDAVELDSLEATDAVADGFDSVLAMKHLLLEMYPLHATDAKHWYRVHFRLDALQQRRRRAVVEDSPGLFQTEELSPQMNTDGRR